MVDQILLLPEGTRYQLLAPVVRGKKGTHTKLISGLAAEGFARVRINGEVRELADSIELDKNQIHNIEGLSPAISIDQKSTSHNPRSTVGTVTEIQDYLRLLFGRAGEPHCHHCGIPIAPQTIDEMVDQILLLPEGTRYQLLAPVAVSYTHLTLPTIYSV